MSRLCRGLVALAVMASILTAVPTLVPAGPAAAQSGSWFTPSDWTYPDDMVDDRAPTNGCGSQGEDGVDVPDQIFNVSFTPACDWHDQCYGTKGVPRSVCDRGMFTKTLQACAGTILPCERVAIVYFLGVSAFGGDPYRSGQQQACEREPNRPGRVHGDPHLVTLDGAHYSLMAAGEFALLRDVDGEQLVQARFYPQSDAFTVVTGFAVRLGAAEAVVQLDLDTGRLSAFVDGDRVTASMALFDEGLIDLGQLLPGAKQTATIRGSNGLLVDAVVFADRMDISVHVPEPMWGQVSGLLGDADGDPDNDLVDVDGELVDRFDTSARYESSFIDAHRISADESMFVIDGSSFDYHAKDIAKYPINLVTIDDFSGGRAQSASALCGSFGFEDELLDSCIYDVLVSGDDSYAATAALSTIRAQDIAHPHGLRHGEPAEQVEMPALIVAIERRDIAEVRRLVAGGADIDVARSSDGVTPLLTSILMGEDEITQFLLDRGADPDPHPAALGHASPLAAAAVRRDAIDLVRSLLDAGADPDGGSTSGSLGGWVPLVAAASVGDLEVAALLIDAGADVDGVPTEGRQTPLDHALGSTEMMELLLDAGADPNGRWVPGGDLAGPLLAAALGGRVEAVRILLDAGADRRSVYIDLEFMPLNEEIRDLLD